MRDDTKTRLRPEMQRAGLEAPSLEGGGGGERGRGRRPSASATRDLTQGSIPKNLWFLA